MHIEPRHVGGVASIESIAQGTPLVAIVSRYARAIADARQGRVQVQRRAEILAHFYILRL